MVPDPAAEAEVEAPPSSPGKEAAVGPPRSHQARNSFAAAGAEAVGARAATALGSWAALRILCRGTRAGIGSDVAWGTAFVAVVPVAAVGVGSSCRRGADADAEVESRSEVLALVGEGGVGETEDRRPRIGLERS